MKRRSSLFALWAATLVVGGCTTGAALRKEAEVMERQLNRAWEVGGYRCAPTELAEAEAQLAFVRAELSQGNPVRAARHRREARAAVQSALDVVQTCPPLPGDRDGDGVLDRSDPCPDEPEDFDGHDDEDGCPEAEDRDGDTVLDDVDRCPDVPGPVDNGGCPWGDADADGLTDNVDQCPQAPEDVDGFEDEDGCPDPDNDKDGFVDAKDACPLQPETVNGFEDEDGCPDVKTELVRVNRELKKIEIKQRVYFSTARDRIRRRSFKLLAEVADVLKASSTMTVLIEGHTDSVGRSSTNLKLSQRRADAVRNFLVNKGIDASRLTAIGYGEEKPIDTNRTRRGRERNRRVEFKILEE